MTTQEIEEIIRSVLANLTVGDSPERLPETFFNDPKFDKVRFVPTSVWRTGGTVWAIELYRGDRIPDNTVASLAEFRHVDQTIQPAFFVPQGEPFEHLLPVCRKMGIGLIARIADEYDVLTAAESDAVVLGPSAVRIPKWLVGRLQGLRDLNPGFRKCLRMFARHYTELQSVVPVTDEAQEALLRKTFVSLLGTDPRYLGNYAPIDFLKFFERANPLYRGPDHFFHAFNNLLLGCLVMDYFYDTFTKFRKRYFQHLPDWSVEYVWLLTVLFHDVGYPIQRHQETTAIIYGVPISGDNQAAAVRKEVWDSATYRTCRAQLVSLYEHFTKHRRGASWTPDVFPLDERRRHPLDQAFEESFLRADGHGVASSMRMLSDFFREPPQAKRGFLAAHIFVAGLSIPFHDWPVRRWLREYGIDTIRATEFPFASLLMFVDSIQEDRRGRIQEPDVLTGLTLKDGRALPEMNLGVLPGAKLREKKREISDVQSFLVQDALRFQYPPELSS
jgi:hypothetical protein